MNSPIPRLWTPKCADLLVRFNREGVEYLLIGSMAKALHYSARATPNDLDVMINSTPENAKKVTRIFHRFDLHVNENTTKQLAERGQQVRLFNSTDVLTPPKSDFNFCEAAARSTEQSIPNLGISVHLAAMRDLEALDVLREKAEKSELAWSTTSAQ